METRSLWRVNRAKILWSYTQPGFPKVGSPLFYFSSQTPGFFGMNNLELIKGSENHFFSIFEKQNQTIYM